MFYHKYYIVIYGIMATVQIAQASQDENKKYRGGTAGDQTGSETNVKKWYKYSGGWKMVIHCLDNNVSSKVAELIVKLVNSNLVGYDQGERNTLYKALEKYNWSVDKYIHSGEKTETDCSAFVYAVYCCVIPSLRDYYKKAKNCPTTSTVWNVFNQYGSNKFERKTESSIVSSDEYLQVGDLLSSPGHHVVMVVSANGTKQVAEKPVEPVSETVTENKKSSTNNSSKKSSTNNSSKNSTNTNVDGNIAFLPTNISSKKTSNNGTVVGTHIKQKSTTKNKIDGFKDFKTIKNKNGLDVYVVDDGLPHVAY